MRTTRQPAARKRTRPQVAEERATYLVGEEREGKELAGLIGVGEVRDGEGLWSDKWRGG
ncbi:MAG: hypothetical protein HY318_15810 [Armatimonadetes bacterium]|nr:hypothetical protein [Armatimonadota bacterium]